MTFEIMSRDLVPFTNTFGGEEVKYLGRVDVSQIPTSESIHRGESLISIK